MPIPNEDWPVHQLIFAARRLGIYFTLDAQHKLQVSGVSATDSINLVRLVTLRWSEIEQILRADPRP